MSDAIGNRECLHISGVVNETLREEGLRLANGNESGWYYTVECCNEIYKVWVTDI